MTPIGVILLLLVVLGINHFFQWVPYPWTEKKEPPRSNTVTGTVQPAVIDFNKIRDKSDQSLDEMIAGRKKEFGLDDSVDMVVGLNESIKLGQETVALSDILTQIEDKKKQVADQTASTNPDVQLSEMSIGEDSPPATLGPPPPLPEETAGSIHNEFYGVYVVRRGDNLWDIHFGILREYLRHLNIKISDHADETQGRFGGSSGVSRILKYAENMVFIYNIKTKRLDSNLNVIEPETKLVVFNLTHLQKILGSLKPEDLDKIRYDGKELYLPGSESQAAVN